MSEKKQREQVHGYKHHGDKALAESLKAKHLFSDRPEVLVTTFRCKQTDGAGAIVQDASVIIRPHSGLFEVIFNNGIIGRLESGIDILQEALQCDKRSGGLFKARVCRAPGLSRYFDVQLAE